MSSVSPTHLSEIFPLRLKPRQELRFASGNGEILAEKVADGQRYVLKTWQYEMIRRFDGHRTFEEIAKEIYQKFQGEFSAVGLTNFYQWLYDENLVLCECDSIFELVTDEVAELPYQPQSPATQRHAGMVDQIKDKVKQGFPPEKEWQKKAIKISAIVLFSLAVLRIAYIAAPILEPPVNLAYSSIEGYFYQDATPPSQRTAVNDPVEVSMQAEMELAGRVPEVREAMPVVEVDPVPIHEAIPEPAEFEKPSADDLDQLRREMAECRIRRDEFYLQNNEIGYRYEVQKMTVLAKQIGEIEAQLD